MSCRTVKRKDEEGVEEEGVKEEEGDGKFMKFFFESCEERCGSYGCV